MCDPFLLKLRPLDSQPSRVNATPSSGTSPLASYKEVPHVWYLKVTPKHSLVTCLYYPSASCSAKSKTSKNAKSCHGHAILLTTVENNTRYNHNHGSRKIKYFFLISRRNILENHGSRLVRKSQFTGKKKTSHFSLTSRGKHEAINTLCHPLVSPFVMIARICFNVDIFPLVIVLVLHVTSMFNFCLVLFREIYDLVTVTGMKRWWKNVYRCRTLWHTW